MKEQQRKILTETGFGFTAAGKIFFCALAACSCLSMNVYFALVTTVVCAAASVSLDKKILAPSAFLMVALIFVAETAGKGGLPLAVFAGAALYLLISLSPKALDFSPSIKAGAGFGLAFSVTALLTTYYFGIGATGAYTFEILKNYRYLGFHPNWRGVFYGTITLFAMITYPRKFKKLSKYLPAEVFSVAIPLLLNLFLNPNGETTPIIEVGALSDMKALSGFKAFFPIADFSAVSEGENILFVLKGAFALAVIFALFKPLQKKNSIVSASQGGVSSLLGGLPATESEITAYTPVSAVTALAVATAFAVFCPSLVSRIPLHSLAVVFIVSAWKAVPFKLVSSAFKSRDIIEITAFFVCALGFVFTDVFTASIICVIYAVFGRIKK
ncbi:MAG: hypothetical protein Q4D20_10155 [Clostridia bacterium]|nr:hypothetical protein [Clostridia bacterium]